MNDNRRRAHINRYGRVFLPQWRMRQIRWEEAVLNAYYKREDKDIKKYELNHTDCHCGSVGCLGVPWLRKI